MCGIAGILSLNSLLEPQKLQLQKAGASLNKRGPDAEGLKFFPKVGLAHRRLAIIDTSEQANQPMMDHSGRYAIVFNGEIFNYQSIKKDLEKKGARFLTDSDTEVILEAYKAHGTAFLNLLNGFFALAIYDRENGSTILARDRFGIKPLLYYRSDQEFIFASEMKALMNFSFAKEIDQTSLYTYFQLNYIPEPHSIFQEVKKLTPGHYLKIDEELQIQKIPFYQFPFPNNEINLAITYDEAKDKFLQLLDESVQRRLIADVPLGTFLSGGIDSSLITALASRHINQLKTFSIGFEGESHYDETEYAHLLAKKYKTEHHVFRLSQQDLLESMMQSLDYQDEPFADSSALAVNALARETRKHVTVALSGDGADELFAGYNKHRAELHARQKGSKQYLIKKLQPLFAILPKSRNSALSNQLRKLNRFAEGMSLNSDERYWYWASLMNEADVSNLLLENTKSSNYLIRKKQHINLLFDNKDFNAVLATDVNLVLLSDMLRKVDSMSMANSLEVRTPFLDHHLVDFAFSLSAKFKINERMGKRLVRDAGRELLPSELYARPKHGFEVPIGTWFKKDLKDWIEKEFIEEDFIIEQNIFNPIAVKNLWKKALSSNPEDSPANIWGLVCFNSWWKRYIG